jgi:F-type H+-transporting ATPase subunit epsilon
MSSVKKINLKIITPEKVIVDEEIDAVFSKAVDGEFGVLPDHIPFMTPLDVGITRYIQDNNTEYVSTIGGIFQISGNVATIFSETAERGEDIDVQRAKAAMERAETKLRSGARDIDVDRAQAALSRALTRLQAASRSRLGS